MVAPGDDCELASLQPLLDEFEASLHRQALELCALPPDWDGAGAPAISQRAASVAYELAVKATCMECVQPSLAAMPNGGVTVVWTYGGEFVEVEIDPSGAARALVNVRRDSLIEVEFDLTDHPPQFGEWLAQLVSGVGIARILAPAIAAA